MRYALILAVLMAVLSVKGGSADNEVTIIYKGTDDQGRVGLFQSVIPVQLGMTLESGTRSIMQGEVLRCKVVERTEEIRFANGVSGALHKTLLVCKNPDRVLLLEGIGW
jgi:hypothetical protein